MMRFAAIISGVICLNLFAYITIRLRPVIYKVRLYKPMMLNFKLSMLPFMILFINILVFTLLSMTSGYTEHHFILIIAYVLFFVGLLVWLLFLPNAGYLITELNLNHRENDENDVPMWYDIVSVLAFALSGVANTLLNIIIVQLSFLVVLDPQELTSRNYAGLFLIGFCIIVPVVIGIYLGRTLRLNSWDIFKPQVLFGRVKECFSTSRARRDFALYTLINTIFFLIMYVAFGVPFYFM